MRRSLIAVLIGFTLAVNASSATAKDDSQEVQDGIKVGKLSVLRNLVPEKQLEAHALQEYAALKAQAQQQSALGPDTHPQVIRLRAIAKKLIPQVQHWNERAAHWQWEVNLIGSKQINAFCMPGGKIAFFTGILDTLRLTDDEIAIVMGHEMAHALREHGRDRVAKGTALRLGAAITSSLLGLGQTAQTVVGQGAQLTMLKFSRDDETEADLVGLDLAARAGYDPRAGVALWQKMAMTSKSAPPQWLSTHPAGKNRIAQMQKHLPEVMPLFA
jgi:predicted Zn-dependent protease